MTWPLIILAICAIGLSAIGTPVWPWFHAFLNGHAVEFNAQGFSEGGVLKLMLISSIIVIGSIAFGWWLYGRKSIQSPDEKDVLEKFRPDLYPLLANRFYIDELYEATIIRFNAWWAKGCAFLDDWILAGAVQFVSLLTLGLSAVNEAFDRFVINFGFDQGCDRVTLGGRFMSRLQNGQVQHYLRIIGIALVALVLILIWGGGK